MTDASHRTPVTDIGVDEADRASRMAALTLALTLPGDTLLYLLLPLYAAEFGVTLPEAGLLLAANRLIRIAAYGQIAKAYQERGARFACIAGAFGAIIAAAIYATASGLWVLLAGRLVWGLSFAAMNIANQALPTSVALGAAQRTGTSRAIIALGPTICLVLGALSALQFGPRSVFYALTFLACIAPLFAMRIPDRVEPAALSGPRFERPGAISLWSFAAGLTLDGVFIFGLGLLAAVTFPKGAVVAAGLAMALRYAAEVAFSPVGGRLAQIYTARRVTVLVSFASCASLVALAGQGVILWCGVIGTIVLRAITQPLTAPMVAEAHPGPERVPALARQATWRDIGAGTGPLAAGLLLPVLPTSAIYGGAALLLAVTTVMLMRLHAPAPDTSNDRHG